MALVFIFGLCVGSFLSCLVYRLNEQGVLVGRSFCPQCKHQLAWHDNIPLLSFVLLKGRCRYCQKRISLQYPLVELGTGILSLLIFNFQFSIFNLFISYVLIAIFLSDLLYQTIPDQIVYPGIVLGILGIFGNFGNALFSGLAAAGFFLSLVWFTRGRGMGMGDVKLAALMGLFLGSPGIVVALYLSFLTGAIFGVILVLLGKKSLNAHIPFGPFLTTATIISLFWGEILWQKGLALLSLNF